MNMAYSYYDTKCIMVYSLRRWYCEEVVTNLTSVHCPSQSFPEV